MDVDVDLQNIKDEPIKVPFTMRKVSVQPRGLRGIINNPVWSVLIDYAVLNVRNMRYFGSRLIHFHLTRILGNKQNSNIGSIDTNYLRRLFTCESDGSRPPKDDDIRESLEQWNSITNGKIDHKFQPSIRGINTITTKAFETYLIAFEAYHTYGMFFHYQRLVSMRQNISMKMAEKYAAGVFNLLGIQLKPEILEKYGDNLSKIINEDCTMAEITIMKEWKSDSGTSSLSDRIQMHYYIAKELEKRLGRYISMAPLCNTKLPCIELCTKALQDLYKYAISKRGATLVSEKHITGLCYPESIYDILVERQLKQKIKQGKYMITMMTDGILVNMLWCKNIICERTVTNVAKYKKDQAKYKAIKDEKIRNQIENNGKVDKRTTRKQYPKIMEPSKYRKVYRDGLFDIDNGPALNYEYGRFHISAAKRSKEHSINGDTPIVSIDPGHKNILTCAEATINNPIPCYSGSLSLGEFYEKIGNKEYRSQINLGKRKSGVEDAETILANHSLKTVDFDKCKYNVGIHMEHSNVILGYYGSRNHARKRFKLRQNKDRFYDTIVKDIAPDPNTIIALGDAKFAATCSGLSSCPIAKVVDALARRRRVVTVPEYNTTKRCSHCKSPDAVTIQAKSNRTRMSVSGKKYRIPIHGLRHCTKCSQCVNRDKNAARGIFYAFLNNYKHGCMPAFLNKMPKRGEKPNSDNLSSKSVDSMAILFQSETAVPAP